MILVAIKIATSNVTNLTHRIKSTRFTNKYDVLDVPLTPTRKQALFEMYKRYIREVLKSKKYNEVISLLDSIITPVMEEKYIPIFQYLLLCLGATTKPGLPTEETMINDIRLLKEAIENNDRKSILSLFGQKISPIRNRKWAKELGFRIGEDRPDCSIRTPSCQSC